MPRGEMAEEVRQAVALAREAMEVDAAEARKRGWGIPTPDSSSVAMLAAGILVADAIGTAREAAAPRPTTRRGGNRRQTSRTAA